MVGMDMHNLAESQNARVIMTLKNSKRPWLKRNPEIFQK